MSCEVTEHTSAGPQCIFPRFVPHILFFYFVSWILTGGAGSKLLQGFRRPLRRRCVDSVRESWVKFDADLTSKAANVKCRPSRQTLVWNSRPSNHRVARAQFHLVTWRKECEDCLFNLSMLEGKTTTAARWKCIYGVQHSNFQDFCHSDAFCSLFSTAFSHFPLASQLRRTLEALKSKSDDDARKCLTCQHAY